MIAYQKRCGAIAVIEREYQDAKARFAAWDRRVGIAPLREQYERTERALHRAGMRMARTKPTTLAGIAALVNYRPPRTYERGDRLVLARIQTAADALTRMNAEGSQ